MLPRRTQQGILLSKSLPGLRRRGQNLTDRYKRLEESLKGKQEFTHEIENSHSRLDKAAPRLEVYTTTASPRAVHGPKIPKPPADDECCMSGCAICVYDLYNESLEEYRKSISTLRASLTSMGIPQSEWPESLQENTPPARKTAQEVALNAFEEMERALATKTAQASIESQGQPTAGTHPVQSPPSEIESQTKRRNAIPPPPPSTFRQKMTELAEGVRWVLFSNR